MVTQIRAITPKKADRAKKAFAVQAVAFVMAIAETTQSLIINLKGKLKMVVFPNSQSLKLDIELLNARKLLMLYPAIAQTRTTNVLMMLFVRPWI